MAQNTATKTANELAFNRLKRNRFRNAEWILVDGETEVLVAKDPHALVTIAGYLKYIHAKSESQGVYFRGQGKLHRALRPGLYRGIETQGARDKRELALSQTLRAVRDTAGIFSTFGEYAHEPLLQHYGISTTWVDLVDNIWVALWFACNRAIISGKLKGHMHFEERIASHEEQFAYVLLVCADIHSRNRLKPGFYFGPHTELIDLRMATPSVFLRPHAQHALLFRSRGAAAAGRPMDYLNHVCGIIAVELPKALEWLGNGRMVSAHSLFPPPFYDGGYDILLNIDLHHAESIGNIVHVGA